MGISRWDPLNDLFGLRSAAGDLLEDSFVRPRQPGEAPSQSAGLALDVRETNDAFVVTASIPGVAAEDVDITVLDDRLRIRGERREERERPGPQGRWLLRERRFGAFERSVALPTAVHGDGAEADFEHGVLTITLPKAEQAKPRTIPVRASGQPQPQAQPVEVEGGA